MCVVAAHALTYRFSPPGIIQRLADPAAEMGVQLFFVISGYIITTLLLKEEKREGRFSIPAFYIRRFFRILPPLLAYYVGILLFTSVDPFDVAKSAAFTCNIYDCGWFVAHTWSLAVEEQYYLAWPLLLTLIPRRASFLAAAMAVMLTAYLLLPHHWHSNWISFSCIAAGALYATSERVRALIAKYASFPLWTVVGLLFVYLTLGARLSVLTPLLIPFILFGAREIGFVRKILESIPFNAVGLCSYSLYLWQQAFLGASGALPLVLLPVVVVASYFLIEKPFARLGHKLSNRVSKRPAPDAAERAIVTREPA